MRNLMPFLASLMLVLTAWTGVAHASESALCADMPQTQMAAQMDADCEQMQPAMGKQSDPGKGSPHHTTACHVHHVATPAEVGMATVSDIAAIIFIRHQPRIDLTRRDYPAMRPPRA